MKDAMDAEQGSKKVLEITPCIPLILRGKKKQTISILSFPLFKSCPRQSRRTCAGLAEGIRGIRKVSHIFPLLS
jgi:hypothetical protein